MMRLDEVKLLNARTDGPDALAKKHGIPVAEITKQLVKGIKVEMEHTTKRSVAREIALDHIKEDPKYYDKLLKYVEDSAKVNESVAPIVIGGREVDMGSIQLGNVHGWDYPKFSDAFAEYAEFMDGTPLSDDELDQLSDRGDLINQLAHDSFS